MLRSGTTTSFFPYRGLSIFWTNGIPTWKNIYKPLSTCYLPINIHSFIIQSFSVYQHLQTMSDDCYAQRVSDGTYDKILQQLIDMGPAAFGNATFGPPSTDGIGSSPDFFRKLTPRGCDYFWHKDNTQFSTIIFGEICNFTFGTTHCAKGNHYGKEGSVSEPI